MKWNSWPLKDNPKRSIILIIFFCIVGLCIHLSFGLYFFILSIIILFLGIFDYWVPTYYNLDNEGINIISGLTHKSKKWQEFKSFYIDKNGILLSPFDKPTRLENFRGIYIRFNNNKEEVINFIKAKIKNDRLYKRDN